MPGSVQKPKMEQEGRKNVNAIVNSKWFKEVGKDLSHRVSTPDGYSNIDIVSASLGQIVPDI